jgi:ABC-type branched-subunit amino acid transport system substrate-binding protein/DNA-binding beta-propeller fold protein YncE
MDESWVAAGTELGGYRIEAPLGRGGMGVVYRAHDLALDRKVALKLLAPELAADVGFRERFMRESRLAASLDDSAIIPIYDAGQAGDQLYIAMRLVDGTDLKRLLRADGRLEPARALRLLEQVAGALDVAHERGLVHRDVKPSNILVDSREHCYLADFGLSRRIADADGAGDGRSLGTIDYVAPEQIRGGEPDGRADLYSLGCVLYECLAGRPPFTGSDTAIAFAHLEHEPPSLPRLEPVFTRALAKEPDDRYPTGRALIEHARELLGISQARRAHWPLAAALVGVAAIAAVAAAFVLTRDATVVVTPGARVAADPQADSLVHIDPDSNRVTSTMRVGREVTGVASSGAYVWVTSFGDGSVWRIDAVSRAVRKVRLGGGSPTGVAAVHGLALVATDGERGLVSIGAADASPSPVQRRPGDFSGRIPVAAGDEGLWFADAARHLAAQVQAFEGAPPSTTIRVPGDQRSFLSGYKAFDDLAAGEGFVWAVGDAFGRTLWKLDPISQKVVASIRLPFVPGRVAAGEGAVWVTSVLDDAVWKIDPVRNRITARIPVPPGVSAIATGPGAVWVASSQTGVISRIQPQANRIAATIRVHARPTHLAADAGGLWVTTTKATARVPRAAIGIGVLADCTGAFGSSYDESLAGAQVALLGLGGARGGPNVADGMRGVRIRGRAVSLAFGCSQGTSASALAEARRLVEEAGVRVLIGPTNGEEELALQEYARRRPAIAFINGVAGAQELDPPDNVFSFAPDAAAQMAGLAEYAYDALGWRRAVIVADADAAIFNWTQTAGFIAEFCSLGGTIAKRIWVPRGTQRYAGVVAQIPPTRVDGFVAAASPRTVAEVVRRYPGLRGDLGRKLLFGVLIGGGDLGAIDNRLSGVLASGHFFPQGPNSVWDAYNDAIRSVFPDIGSSQQPPDLAYNSAMAATVSALTAVRGDLTGGERRFMRALARVRLITPMGPVRLDARRRAVALNYVVNAKNIVFRRMSGVEATFGGYFGPGDPPPGKATPACKRRKPPAWAR